MDIKDLRNVSCPINFIKIKLTLDKLPYGSHLTVFLDDGSPIDNVPKSIELEGHEIVDTQWRDGYWEIVIEKH